LNNRLAFIHEGLSTFESFKQTDHYKEIAEFEHHKSDAVEISVGLKALIDALHNRIYTILERYNDLQSAVNKFLGNFLSQNIFGFKTILSERSDFIEFAEMLEEFLEENKILQYEKRVERAFCYPHQADRKRNE
jgi:hypothetical protein